MTLHFSGTMHRYKIGLQENAKLHTDLINYNKELFSIVPSVCQKH